MLRKMLVISFAILLVALMAHPAWALQVADTVADSTGTGTVPAHIMSPVELLTWGAAIAGAYLFKKWNVAQGRLDGISNFMKAIAATLLVAVMAAIARWLGITFSGGDFALTQDGFASFLAGIGTTILVRVGIISAKAKAAAPPSRP